MSLLPRTTLHSDSEQLYIAWDKDGGEGQGGTTSGLHEGRMVKVKKSYHELLKTALQ